MSAHGSKPSKRYLVWVVLLVLGVGMACQLTSPRPASWAGTPTAEARSTEIALTQAAINAAGAFIFTPTLTTAIAGTTPTPTITPTPQDIVNGPWLVYPGPEGRGLLAYDLGTKLVIEINIPEPIISTDLQRGQAPDGSKLILRAGSALMTDELALYQIDLPSFEVSKVSPLLSLPVQRKIVNNEGSRVLETLWAVTRSDGLAWSPNGRYLAFTAALDNETSDLYVYDTLNDRIDRLNGLFTQNASPQWSPGGAWLISQELAYLRQEETWRAEQVSGLRVPGLDSQNVIYLPPLNSLEEVFLGWLNPNTFVSYSLTEAGPRTLRQVNMDELEDLLIYDEPFQQVAYDPDSGVLALILGFDEALLQGLSGGIYRLLPDSPGKILQAAGDWDALTADVDGLFVASGSQGVLLFTPDGESMLLPGQRFARLSPNGNWLIAWGDGNRSTAGARLYQPNSGRLLQQVTDQPVESLFWQPDSNGFFLFAEGKLYHYLFPGLIPVEIIAGLPAETIYDWVWVE